MDKRWPVTAMIALASAACVGTLGGDDAAQPAAESEDTDASKRDDADALPTFVPAPGALRRLTLSEYTTSIHDLLGDVAVPTELEADLFAQGFSTVGAAKAPIGANAIEKLDAAALDVAHQVFGDASRRRALVGCTPAASDPSCTTTFVTRFGRRVFRRPLASEEVERYVGVATKASAAYGGDRGPWSGLEYATAALLESPYFLYRAELGEPDPTHEGRRRYSGYEMAGRLSFFLWGTAPDDALLDAAGRGVLTTKEGLSTAAARLLAAPRAADSLLRFFREHLTLPQLDQLAKDQSVYPTFTDDLGVAMRGEIERMLDPVIRGDADFRSLFDTARTYVSGPLAKLYGLRLPDANGDAFVPVTLPADGPRAGILTTAGLLALKARNGRSSPTLRGILVTTRFLCWEPGDPPPDADESMVDDAANAGTTWKTMRERLDVHRKDPRCATCHKTLDPPGLALEAFDGIGAYRETDHGAPLDLSGDIGGEAFVGARGLAAALKKDPRVPECLARQVYRFATGHRETHGEEAVIKQVAARALEHGVKLRALAIDVVKSDGFRFLAAPPSSADE